MWRSNGVLLASSFHSAMFSLITALVIYSAKPLVHSFKLQKPVIRGGSAVYLKPVVCQELGKLLLVHGPAQSAGHWFPSTLHTVSVCSADEGMAEGSQLQLECWQHRYAHMLLRFLDPLLATPPKSTLCVLP